MTKLIETVQGAARVRLKDRYASWKVVLRRYQDYDHGVPTVQHAKGKFLEMPFGDAAFAMMEGKPLDVELEDNGRKMQVLIEDVQGNFRLTGPIVEPIAEKQH